MSEGKDQLLGRIDLSGFVEPEPIEASHLVRTRCAGCGGEALAAPGRAREASCAECLGGSVTVPAGSMAYTVPVGYPLGPAPEGYEGGVPYPAPVVTSRDGREPGGVGWPGAVLRVEGVARSNGWAVRRQYARGRFPNGSTGRPGVEYASYGLSMRLRGWGAYAVYVGTSWRSVMLWGVSLPWFPAASVTDLTGWLAEPDRDASWYEGIRERNRLAEERRKLREQCNKGVHVHAEFAPQGVAVVMCPVCGNSWSMGGEPWRKPAKAREGAT